MAGIKKDKAIMNYRTAQIHIYVLRDPRDRSIKYVGQTRYPATRLSQHVSGAIASHSISKNKKNIWILELLELGKRPIIEFVTTSESADEATDIENQLIRKFASIGYNLVNHDGVKTKCAKKSIYK